MKFSTLFKGLTIGAALVGGGLGTQGTDTSIVAGLLGGLVIGAIFGASMAVSFWSIPFGEMGRIDRIRL